MIKLIKFILKFRKHGKAWYKLNEPLGIDLGYPKCCIREFGQYPPIIIRWFKIKGVPLPDGRLKYDAGCINGKFTGFIPCAKHARLIDAKKITLESLIKNRNPLMPPFPQYAWYDIEDLNKN